MLTGTFFRKPFVGISRRTARIAYFDSVFPCSVACETSQKSECKSTCPLDGDLIRRYPPFERNSSAPERPGVP